MDLQTIVNAINKTGFENRSKQMFTLGDLIQDLEKLPQNADITIEPFHLVPDFSQVIEAIILIYVLHIKQGMNLILTIKPYLIYYKWLKNALIKNLPVIKAVSLL